MSFPVYVHFGPYTIHPHIFFESLGYLVAVAIYFALRRRFQDTVSIPLRWSVVAAAIAGGAFGAKFLTWLEDPRLTLQHLHDPAFFIGGKTIIGALAGGVLVVELFKRYIGLRVPTGDLYAIPLAFGIAIGRVGCFLTGLSDNTYGTPTRVPWAVNFGDNIPRHPTQLYEIIFLLTLTPLLYAILKKSSRPKSNSALPTTASIAQVEAGFPASRARPGDPFKFFMVSYATFRFLIDFLKPYPRVFLGLGTIQWACLLILLYYSHDVARWLRPNAAAS